MKLGRLRLGGSRAPSQPRRRRPARPDAPRTIIPVEDADAAEAGPVEPQPFAERLDAARARLRDAIPPVEDETP